MELVKPSSPFRPESIALPDVAYYQIRAALAELDAAQLRAHQQALVLFQQWIAQARDQCNQAIAQACGALLDPALLHDYEIDLVGHRLIRKGN